MTIEQDDLIDVRAIPPLGHLEAQDLFVTEVDRTAALVESLAPEDWSRQTDCPAWDVRRLYLHVLGAHESGASMREFAHQMRASARYRRAHGGPPEAALSWVQVSDREALTPDDLLRRLRPAGLAASRQRRRLPAALRALRITADPDDAKWRVGYLTDTIYLRDLWMHRVDACRATDRTMVVTPDHDGRIVADIVREWSERHGQSFRLTLTGPAGGRYRRGSGGDAIDLDAVEFCRILAGRGEARGLLSTSVPF